MTKTHVCRELLELPTGSAPTFPCLTSSGANTRVTLVCFSVVAAPRRFRVLTDWERPFEVPYAR